GPHRVPAGLATREPPARAVALEQPFERGGPERAAHAVDPAEVAVREPPGTGPGVPIELIQAGEGRDPGLARARDPDARERAHQPGPGRPRAPVEVEHRAVRADRPHVVARAARYVQERVVAAARHARPAGRVAVEDQPRAPDRPHVVGRAPPYTMK